MGIRLNNIMTHTRFIKILIIKLLILNNTLFLCHLNSIWVRVLIIIIINFINQPTQIHKIFHNNKTNKRNSLKHHKLLFPLSMPDKTFVTFWIKTPINHKQNNQNCLISDVKNSLKHSKNIKVKKFSKERIIKKTIILAYLNKYSRFQLRSNHCMIRWLFSKIYCFKWFRMLVSLLRKQRPKKKRTENCINKFSRLSEKIKIWKIK